MLLRLNNHLLLSTSHTYIDILYLLFHAISRIGATALRLLIQVKLGQPGTLVCGNQIYNVISIVYTFQIISFNGHQSYK